jgi:hypothetical protein
MTVRSMIARLMMASKAIKMKLNMRKILILKRIPKIIGMLIFNRMVIMIKINKLH